MRRKIPWDEIRKKYITGIEREGKIEYPSQRELAKEYGIDPSIIGRRAKKEGWREQRQIYISKLSAEGQQRKIEEISERGVQFDLECFDISFEAVKKIKEIIKNGEKKDLISLSQALEKYQKVGKSALGEKTGEENIININIKKGFDD